MQINVSLAGIDAVQKKLASLSAAQASGAISMAINKTTAKAKTEINRAITQRYQIARAEVANSVAINAASKSKPRATITLFGSAKKRGRSLNLIHFTERKVTLAQGRKRAKDGTQNQLRFNIVRGQGGKMIPGSFVGNKGRTIFERIEGKYMGNRINVKGNSKHAQAIAPVQVVGIGQMFNFRSIHTRVLAKINKDLATEMDRAIAQKLRQAA